MPLEEVGDRFQLAKGLRPTGGCPRPPATSLSIGASLIGGGVAIVAGSLLGRRNRRRGEGPDRRIAFLEEVADRAGRQHGIATGGGRHRV